MKIYKIQMPAGQYSQPPERVLADDLVVDKNGQKILRTCSGIVCVAPKEALVICEGEQLPKPKG